MSTGEFSARSCCPVSCPDLAVFARTPAYRAHSALCSRGCAAAHNITRLPCTQVGRRFPFVLDNVLFAASEFEQEGPEALVAWHKTPVSQWQHYYDNSVTERIAARRSEIGDLQPEAAAADPAPADSASASAASAAESAAGSSAAPGAESKWSEGAGSGSGSGSGSSSSAERKAAAAPAPAPAPRFADTLGVRPPAPQMPPIPRRPALLLPGVLRSLRVQDAAGTARALAAVEEERRRRAQTDAGAVGDEAQPPCRCGFCARRM